MRRALFSSVAWSHVVSPICGTAATPADRGRASRSPPLTLPPTTPPPTWRSSAPPQLPSARAGIGRAMSIGIGYEVAGVTLLKYVLPLEYGMILLSEDQRVSIADFQRIVTRARTQEQ